MNEGQAARAASGTAANLYAELLPEWMRARAKDFFSWTVELDGTTPLAAGTSTPTNFQVDGDSSAVLVAVTGVVSDAGLFTLTPTVVPIKVFVRDTGSGRYFQNIAVMWDALVGTAQLPGFLPYPKLVPKSSTVNVTLQNLDGANAYDVHLTFQGFKIFPWLETEDPAVLRAIS